MQNKTRANLELGAQIVIAIAVILVAGLLVRQQFFPSKSRTNMPQISAGEKLNVPNVDWERNKKSLVFFLQKGCVYCTSSAPFYRQLIADASSKNVTSLAILPNSAADAREYLQALELQIDNVQTGSLASYKVNGTPTVLFVDGHGIIRSVWSGAMPEREKEMRDKLYKLFEVND
jgi:thioredoxin-related protein